MLTPMPTQVEDAEFLTRTGNAALWSEPGTGKTLSTILALKQSGAGRSLVVAPPVALEMWCRELEAHGLKDAVVMSWGMITKLADEVPTMDALVLDEAHYAVRTDAKRTQAIYGDGANTGLVHKAGVVWPLTGTPMIRFADDLWPTLSGLWPAHLDYLRVGSRFQFEMRYCQRDSLGRIVGSRDSSLKLLNRVLAGEKDPPQVVMRRTLAEVAPFLPPVTVRQLQIPLSNEQTRAVNSALPTNWMQRLADAERGLIEAAYMATARRYMSLLKVPSALEMIADAPAKVIVVFVHTETGEALAQGLKEPHLLIQGDTPNNRRQKIVDQFNMEGGPRVLLGQLHTMGVAINPHERCSHMIFVERDWSAAVLEQAMNRVRRLGQTQHQQIDFLDTSHDLDRAMRRAANRKLKSMGVLTGDE